MENTEYVTTRYYTSQHCCYEKIDPVFLDEDADEESRRHENTIYDMISHHNKQIEALEDLGLSMQANLTVDQIEKLDNDFGELHQQLVAEAIFLCCKANSLYAKPCWMTNECWCVVPQNQEWSDD